MAASVLAFCLDWEERMAGGRASSGSGTIPRDRYDKIVEALSEVGTWDRLEFYGTRVVAGDVISLRVGARTYRRPELLERADGRPIRLRWTRGRVWGLLKAVNGLGPLGRMDLGKIGVEISPADAVTFHAVGEREPSACRLVELDRIVLG
jgi:hypothetical protein